MLATALSAAIVGVDGVPVRVEVDVSFGLPGLTIVGLAGSAVLEARERVRAAIRNSGFEVPARRITVNLAPAGLPKGGAEQLGQSTLLMTFTVATNESRGGANASGPSSTPASHGMHERLTRLSSSAACSREIYKSGIRSSSRERTVVPNGSARWVRLTWFTTALSVTTMSQYGIVEPIASMSLTSFAVHVRVPSRWLRML